MIQRQQEDISAWRYCCSISFSLSIHQKKLFWSDAEVCADIYFVYDVVRQASPTLQVTLSFRCHQISSKI